MTHPFPGFAVRAGISASVKSCGFLESEDGSPELICQPYRPMLVVTGQVPAEFKYL